ncbi:MAG: hypothetical protein P8O07_01730 [Crocinitomicaceae bacterium]|nr:hypothetical protein [Crocinitomicaceae bacterium]
MKLIKITTITFFGFVLGNLYCLSQNAISPSESILSVDVNYSTQYNSLFRFLELRGVIGTNNTGIVIGIQRENLTKGNIGDEISFITDSEKYSSNFFGDPGRIYNHSLSQSDVDELTEKIESETSSSVESIYLDNYNYYSIDRGWTFKLGYQYGFPFGLYFNAGVDFTTNRTKDLYDVYYYTSNSGFYDTFEDRGWAFGVRLWTGIGYALDLGKDKKYYLNAQATYNSIQYTATIERNFIINAGFGFRIGAQGKTSIQGTRGSSLATRPK